MREDLHEQAEERNGGSTATPDQPLAAVYSRITKRRGTETASILAGLVRALYLDTSSFHFDSLERLDESSRRLAEALIRAKLSGSIPQERWEKAHHLTREFEAHRPAEARAEAPPVLSSVMERGALPTEAPRREAPLRDWMDKMDALMDAAKISRPLIASSKSGVARPPARRKYSGYAAAAVIAIAALALLVGVDLVGDSGEPLRREVKLAGVGHQPLNATAGLQPAPDLKSETRADAPSGTGFIIGSTGDTAAPPAEKPAMPPRSDATLPIESKPREPVMAESAIAQKPASPSEKQPVKAASTEKPKPLSSEKQKTATAEKPAADKTKDKAAKPPERPSEKQVAEAPRVETASPLMALALAPGPEAGPSIGDKVDAALKPAPAVPEPQPTPPKPAESKPTAPEPQPVAIPEPAPDPPDQTAAVAPKPEAPAKPPAPTGPASRGPGEDWLGGHEELDLGLRQFAAGNYPDAAANLQKALQAGLTLKRDRVKAQKHLALAQCAQGQDSLCRSGFATLLKLDPDHELDPKEVTHDSIEPIFRSVKTAGSKKTTSETRAPKSVGEDWLGGAEEFDLGLKQFETGNYQEAASSLQKALNAGLTLKRDQVKAHKHIALAHCAQGRETQCRDAFARLLKLDPEHELDPKDSSYRSAEAVFRSVKLKTARK